MNIRSKARLRDGSIDLTRDVDQIKALLNFATEARKTFFFHFGLIARKRRDEYADHGDKDRADVLNVTSAVVHFAVKLSCDIFGSHVCLFSGNMEAGRADRFKEFFSVNNAFVEKYQGELRFAAVTHFGEHFFGGDSDTPIVRIM
jgi:hypothetical protein